MNGDIRFAATLWRYQGKGGWTFVTLPDEAANDVRLCQLGRAGRAWGMIKAEVQIGDTNLQTTLWPDKASGSFVLPVKAAVRKREKIGPGDTVDVILKLIGADGGE